MESNQQKGLNPSKGKKSQRQQRLGVALRENLRKRKTQTQIREKSKIQPQQDIKNIEY